MRKLKNRSASEKVFSALLYVGMRLAADMLKRNNMVQSYNVIYRIDKRMYLQGDYDNVGVISTTWQAAQEKAELGFSEANMNVVIHDIQVNGESVVPRGVFLGVGVETPVK